MPRGRSRPGASGPALCAAAAALIAGAAAAPAALAQEPLPDAIDAAQSTLSVVRLGELSFESGVAIPGVRPEAARVGERDGSPLIHLTWEPPDALPDDPASHALVALDATRTRGETLVEWRGPSDVRVLVVDLDGDGRAEVVRDAPDPRPCGQATWVAPEVLVDGAFVPIRVRPGVPAGTPVAHGSPTELGAAPMSELFASNALPHTPTPAPGAPVELAVGQWFALAAPAPVVEGVALSSNGSGRARLLARADDGASTLIDLGPGSFETALPSGSRCVTLTVVDVADGALALTAAQLLTSLDSASPEALGEAWLRGVDDACREGGPGAGERLADRAVAAGFGGALAASDSACVAAALARAVPRAGADPVALALDPATSEQARIALLGTADRRSLRVLAEVVMERLGQPEDGRGENREPDDAPSDGPSDELTEALLAALARTGTEALDAERRSSGCCRDAVAALDRIVAAAPQNAELRPLALDLVQRGLVPRLSEAPPRDPDAAVFELLLVARAETADVTATALRARLAHDNGSVARLALYVVGRHRVDALASEVEHVLDTDPMPHLRAEAFRTLSALGAAGPRAAALAADPTPEVRLAVARSSEGAALLASEPARLLELLGREAWPEVRRGWIATAIGLDATQLDDAVTGWISAGPAAAPGADAEEATESPGRADLAFALRTWSARGRSAPPAALAAGRSSGDPEALRWAAALVPVVDGACADIAWLGALRDDDTLPESTRAAAEAAAAYCTGSGPP